MSPITFLWRKIIAVAMVDSRQTVCVLLCCICCFNTVFASYSRVCTGDEPAKGMCGKSLSTLLDTVCKMYGGFQGPSKRSIRDTKPVAIGVLEELRESLFQPKERALSYFGLRKRRTGRTGTLTCECCYHSCAMTELTQYCASASRKRSLNQLTDLYHLYFGANKDDGSALQDLGFQPAL
ncbi:con-Ins Im2 [Lingula anatina]|uniref:Con-Ins Im2 n=1 Tax=Lingula anatina TaxID=7574 RepID=A0A1S3K250_LINAN|nr:con-Ins Im2 [Lingula anatina]|eukprot:XP_013416474.1 con-Ins Im2 [Lingula anatina]